MSIYDRLCAAGLDKAVCSVYASATDRDGQYVDRDTGECVTEMSIADFVMGEAWKEYVFQLRALIEQHGALAAKKLPEYVALKKKLPGATLSGKFSRRRADGLVKHTGYLCLDIDLQDNQQTDMTDILMVLEHRPEIALYMQSCSGTGYFALVRLAYPEQHKSQFAALMEDYASLGIMLDRACSDVSRIRFASFDPTPYVNPFCVPYKGLLLSAAQTIAPKAAFTHSYSDDPDRTLRKVSRLAEQCERAHIDLTSTYENWFKIGLSLKTLPDQQAARQIFHQLSRVYSGYDPNETDRKWEQLPAQSTTVTIGFFFQCCRSHGLIIGNQPISS